MKIFIPIFIFFVVMLGLTTDVYADCGLSEDSNWNLIHTGTVTGYREENGKADDDFEGCNFGRILIIDYNKKVTCSSYSYSYSYMPTIEIFSDGYSLKACINSDTYDVRR
jgi:hypothetical protein